MTRGATLLAMIIAAVACDSDDSSTEAGEDHAGPDHEAPEEYEPPLLTERGRLEFEDELDRLLTQPASTPPPSLLERSALQRKRLMREGLVGPESTDTELIEAIRVQWFVRGQGVTVQNTHESEVYVSVEFLGDAGCRDVATRRPVEPGGSLAIKPTEPGCDFGAAQLTIFNDLGLPIHVGSLVESEPLAARKSER